FHGGAAEATLRDDEPDPRRLDKRELVALVRELRDARGTSVQRAHQARGSPAPRADRPRVSPLHPTTKPVDLVARHVGNSSRRGELVYDPFGGAGTTLIAAANLERRCAMLELEPGYCDVIVDRWQRHTGDEAELERPARRRARAAV